MRYFSPVLYYLTIDFIHLGCCSVGLEPGVLLCQLVEQVGTITAVFPNDS